MEIVTAAAEKYADEHSSAQTELLQKIASTTAAHPHAHMMSSPLQGKFLSMVSKMLQPRRILEVGTFTGFSALCLAEGLIEDGEIHTIELREADATTARSYFDESPLGKKIILYEGNAREIIPTLKEEWDLVFIDADKAGYIEYYELTLATLKKAGYILADNVLFHGQVLEDEVKTKNAKAIQAFNTHVAADPRTEQVMLTIRDGLTLIIKL